MKIVSINHNSRIPTRTVDDSPLVGEWDGKEQGIIITGMDAERKRTVHVILTKDDIDALLSELQRLAMQKRDVPSPASDWIILRQQQQAEAALE